MPEQTMRISWNDDELWCVTLNENQLRGFVRPYIGSGVMGVQVAELVVFSDDASPLLSVIKTLYDAGEQIYLPEWSRFQLTIGGRDYSLKDGRHKLRHCFDFRTGEVTLRDSWQYATGKTAEIRISLLLPRIAPCTGFIGVEVDSPDAVELRFGLNAQPAAEQFESGFTVERGNVLLAIHRTREERREIRQALWWEVSGASVHVCAPTATASAPRGKMRLSVIHMVGASLQNAVMANEDPLLALDAILAAGEKEMRLRNDREWHRLWAKAVLPPVTNRKAMKAYLAGQYYLLASLSDNPQPTGPLGVSKIGWRGLVFWDADLWVCRAILPVWSEFARAHLEYRFAGLEQARRHAAETGFQGARYGWCSDDRGIERAHPHYLEEIHINIWIALAFWEYYQETKDLHFLEERAWPVLRGIADFFASRAVRESDGKLHIRNVIGPDEAVAEFGAGACDDHHLTNLGASYVMNWACMTARILGNEPPESWEAFEKGIFLQRPGADGVIPEFTGYSGQGIKQADVILAFCIFKRDTDAATVRRNIEYYHQRIMGYGPFMNAQVECCLRMRTGDREREWAAMENVQRQYTRGPHYLLFECRAPENKNSVFLTAIGGILHTLVYGYYGYNLGARESIPRIGDSWESSA